jgi:L-lactate dehydrogenase (cytochrome)
MSICSIEDVAAHTKQAVLVPALRDARPRLHRAPDRPRQGRQLLALVLTLDLQILGQRHKDLKNGLSAPPKPTLANILDMMTKPRWCLGMLGTKRRSSATSSATSRAWRHGQRCRLDGAAVRPAR